MTLQILRGVLMFVESTQRSSGCRIQLGRFCDREFAFRIPWSVEAFFYRTFAGAEVDLVLELSEGERWAIEIKRGLSDKPEKGFYYACEGLKPTLAFVVYSADERHPITERMEAIGL